MKSIVIAYEDEYCEALHGLIRKLRNDNGLPGLCLESRAVKGNAKFVNEVPRILRTALKVTKRPPDRLVCLADADKLQTLISGTQHAPSPKDDAETLTRWVLELERAWKELLVCAERLEAEAAARLHVICLRWSKESLLISSPDALLEYAARRERHDRVNALVDQCEPCPKTLADGDFVVRYRKPSRCLEDVVRAMEDRGYKKGLDDEDILRDFIAPNATRRAQLLKRCPDLERLLRLLG